MELPTGNFNLLLKPDCQSKGAKFRTPLLVKGGSGTFFVISLWQPVCSILILGLVCSSPSKEGNASRKAPVSFQPV